MHWSSSLRSGAFRFAFLFAAVFAIGSALLLVLVDRSVDHYAREMTKGTLATEAAVLAGQDSEDGRTGLLHALVRRANVRMERQFQYLLIDRAGRRIIGAIPASAAREGWSTVRMREEAPAPEDEDHPELLTTLGTRLADGALLVVATDSYDIANLRWRIGRFTILCGLAITMLALVGGWAVGSLFLARLDRVNGVVDRIMKGRLDERLPDIGMGPEFDQLSRNLNRMLDRIGTLVEGLRQVSTDIAHDLRTPLTRLRQQLEQTRLERAPEAIDTGIEVALNQTDEMLGIFRALLRLAQIEGAAGRHRMEQVDLAEVMTRIGEAFEPAIEDAGKALILDLPQVPIADGDAELLAQLFANLLENAISHTPRGTTIRMTLTTERDRIAATVADNGPGVAAAERAKILRRFYQVDGSRNAGGAGLGLSLVAAIAALHEADLAIHDAGPGLAVTLSFPPTGSAPISAAS